MTTRHNTGLWLLMGALVIPGLGCRDRSSGSKAGSTGRTPATSRPASRARDRARPRPRPRSGVAAIRQDLRSPGNDDRHYNALDRLVKGWPATREALTDALWLLRTDGTIRGGVALSLARLGPALVRPLLDMVARDPTDKATLVAAGVLAYHLVSPQGLTPRSEAEREKIRAALRPLQKPLWQAFLADNRPDYEIYQGVAVGAADTVKRFRPPFAKSGLTRVAMVLYLILTRKKQEAFLPPKQRAALRKQAAPLAAHFAKALGRAKNDGSGESPDSLVLGLSVLGRAGAAAVAREKTLRTAERCPHVVKALVNVQEQAGDAAVVPARAVLQRCVTLLPDPALTRLAKGLLAKLK